MSKHLQVWLFVAIITLGLGAAAIKDYIGRDRATGEVSENIHFTGPIQFLNAVDFTGTVTVNGQSIVGATVYANAVVLTPTVPMTSTNVQEAFVEIITRTVAKAGDTMNGPLTVPSLTATVVTLETVGISGTVSLTSCAEMTITVGEITPTTTYVRVHPESGTADNLVTVHLAGGQWCWLTLARPLTDTITLQHATGNLSLSNNANIPMTSGGALLVGGFDGLVYGNVGGGGGLWGSIVGTLSNQADLQAALDLKVNMTALAAVATSGTYTDLIGKPSLAAVATTGDYSSLSGTPTIPAINDAAVAGATTEVFSADQVIGRFLKYGVMGDTTADIVSGDEGLFLETHYAADGTLETATFTQGYYATMESGALNDTVRSRSYAYEGSGSWSVVSSSPTAIAGTYCVTSVNGASTALFKFSSNMADFELASNEDFWAEGWINSDATGGGYVNMFTVDGIGLNLRLFPTQTYARLTVNSSNYDLTDGRPAFDGQWHHIAFGRSAGVIMYFIDGVKHATTISYSAAMTGTTQVYFSDSGASGVGQHVAFDELRWIKGQCLHTSSFTPGVITRQYRRSTVRVSDSGTGTDSLWTASQVSGAIATAVAPKANAADLATVANSGEYGDLTGTPPVPHLILPGAAVTGDLGSGAMTATIPASAIAATATAPLTGGTVQAQLDEIAGTLATVPTTRTGVYRELWLPATAWTGTVTYGAIAGSLTSSGTSVTVPTLDFASDHAHYAWGMVPMPAAWDGGDVRLKVYWTAEDGTVDTYCYWWAYVGTVSYLNDTTHDTLDANFYGNDFDLFGLTGNRAYKGARHLHVAKSAAIASGAPSGRPNPLLRIYLYRYPGLSGDTYDGTAKLVGVLLQYVESTTEPSVW